MPANTDPLFSLVPNIGLATVSAANTASDGSGSLVTLFTAGSNGSRLERVRYSNAQATAALSSAMVIRLFITDSGGANPRLLAEVPVPAITRTTSVPGAAGIYTFANGLVIPTGTIVKVIQSVYAGVQDLMHYVAEGGDF
jgi:hypothetical protein